MIFSLKHFFFLLPVQKTVHMVIFHKVFYAGSGSAIKKTSGSGSSIKKQLDPDPH